MILSLINTQLILVVLIISLVLIILGKDKQRVG